MMLSNIVFLSINQKLNLCSIILRMKYILTGIKLHVLQSIYKIVLDLVLLQMIFLTPAMPQLFTTHRANERSSFVMHILNMLILISLAFEYATTAWLRALNLRFNLTNMQMSFQILQIVCHPFITFSTFVCFALHV